MKQFLLIFATMLFMSVSLNAQAPDVHVSPDKYVKDIGKQLKVLQNRKGKYGYVDEKGKFYIKPVFDDAKSFERKFNGRYLAVVRYGDKWRIISDNGQYFPDTHVEFDAQPWFIDIYIFCESNGELTRRHLDHWNDSVPYDKIELDNKVLYMPKEADVKSKQSIYIADDSGKKREYISSHLNVIGNESYYILESYSSTCLADKSFNILTEDYDYMQTNGVAVVGLRKNGEGLVFLDGQMTNFILSKEEYGIDDICREKDAADILKCRELLNLISESSGMVLRPLQNDKYDIIKDGKYGLVDIGSGKCIPPMYDSLVRSGKRYLTFDRDLIFYENTIYEIPDYEIFRYRNTNGGDRYDLVAQEYLDDSFLTHKEKIHYKEVSDRLAKWKEDMASRDDELFNMLSPEEYLMTDRIPFDYKKHVQVAENAAKKNDALNRLFEDMVQMNIDLHILGTRARFLNEKSNLGEEIQKWDGNYYTHQIYGYNGFRFRNNAITGKTEIVVNDFEDPVYIPLSQISSCVDYQKYAAMGHIMLYDGRVLLIYSDYNHIHSFGDVMSFASDSILGYSGRNDNVVDMLIVDSTGNMISETCVALSQRHLNIRPEYFFMNATAMRKTQRGIDCYDYYSDYSIRPVETRTKTEEDKSLMSLLYLYDYDLNPPLIYASKEGEFIHDVIKYGDKWVFVGSTINNGYVGWENPYVVLLDSELNVLATSYLPMQGRRLKAEEVLLEGVYIPTELRGNKMVKIKRDNTIQWLY